MLVSTSRLERAIIVLALLVLLLTLITFFGMLPRRSFSSMLVGFTVLGASCVELLFVGWFVARQILSKYRSSRPHWIVLLACVIGVAPFLTTAVRLLVEAYI